MDGIFITATDTGVGKTFFACKITRFLKRSGVNVGVMKPAGSGGLLKNGRLVSGDALMLQNAAQTKDPMEWINPICFKNPLAPYPASMIEKKKFKIKKIVSAYKKIRQFHSFVVVEGIGGVRVPLDKNFEVADLIKKMNLPAIVVVSSKLGTLNHTLLTLDYLRRKKVKVLGIVLNYFDSKKAADRTNLQFFKNKKITVLAILPRNKNCLINKNIVSRSLIKSLL